MSRRVFVSLSGGVIDEVIVPPRTDGSWTVFDWDNVEANPPKTGESQQVRIGQVEQANRSHWNLFLHACLAKRRHQEKRENILPRLR
jgi:hypothetical protein